LISAQNTPSAIQFHGTNKLFGQYSNSHGFGSEIPASYLRDDLQMTFTIYDLPFSARTFYTTEQKDYRQAINNFRFYLDVLPLKRKVDEKLRMVIKYSTELTTV